jgi:hypothetical protein
MTQIENIRTKVVSKEIPPIFSRNDLRKADVDTDNLSNFDKKNKPTTNENKKVLVSREIAGETYYTFDEQLFD